MENEIISVMIHTYCSQYEAYVMSLQLDIVEFQVTLEPD